MHARTPVCFLLGALLLGLTAVVPTGVALARSGGVGSSVAGQPAVITRQIAFAGSRITFSFPQGELKLTEQDLSDWVRHSARAITTFLGRFPVARVRIAFEATDSQEVEEGVAWTDPEPRIRIQIGRTVTPEVLKADTTLVHEMTHLGFPDLDEAHVWLHEGVATYVETIASAQAGEMTAEAAWAHFLREMPSGLPDRDDHGLDDTESQDRRYWGGALFCLMVDVEIRRRTNNRSGLRDALRAVRAAGGALTETWEVAHTLGVADRSVGVPVLSEMFATWRKRSVTPDLAQLWRDLGIQAGAGHSVRLDDTAPLAAIRRSITKPPAKPMLLVGPKLLYETVRASQ